jgi:oligoribonuclease NrnB/cAMP/cGMP phosphodiesterase (DHH superfamily)
VVRYHAEKTRKKKPIKFIPMDYSYEFPHDTIEKNETIWIVDFSIPPEDMKKLLKTTEDVNWVDHHKSSLEKYKDFGSDIKGVRDISDAGCVLTWKLLFPKEEVPRFIALIGDRDTWAHKLGDDTVNFHAGLQAYNTNPSGHMVWYLLIENAEFLKTVIKNGVIIERYRKQYYKEYLEALGFEAEFEGHKVLALNVARMGSEAFGGDKAMEKWDILMPFYYDGNTKTFTVSLYSKKLDVSKIAMKYGGGGHKGAAGFTTKKLPF